MRSRILSMVAALAVALGVGGFALSQATAAPAPASQVLSTTERGLCIKEGTGAPQSLWLVEATGKCPTGFWGPANLKDAFGIDIDALVRAEVAKQVKTAPGPVDTTPAVKREANVTVNVDFDKTKPIAVTGLPAWKAGSPELWGDNTGSIADASADITVRRVATGTTTCPAAVPAADVAPSVGSTVRLFCAYPVHLSPTTPGVWVPNFLAGQSYRLNVWVYAP